MVQTVANVPLSVFIADGSLASKLRLSRASNSRGSLLASKDPCQTNIATNSLSL